MKAIVVKYLGPTNYKGSRYKATAEGWGSLTINRDYALNSDEDARRAARALLVRALGVHADGYELVDGVLPNGDDVFCLVSK